jgi:hypothetical protein
VPRSRRALQGAALGLLAGAGAPVGLASAEQASPSPVAYRYELPPRAGFDGLRIVVSGERLSVEPCSPSTHPPRGDTAGPPMDCRPGEGLELKLPAAVRGREPRFGRFEVGKAALGSSSFALGERSYEIWLAPPPAKRGSPRLVHAGYSGRSPGADRWATVTPPSEGAPGTVVTRAMLCERSVVVEALALDARTLTLTSTPPPDPLAGERQKSQRLGAAALVDPSVPPVRRFPLLHARTASSGRAALAFDGSVNTAWSEELPGAGTGAFVVGGSARTVPFVGLEIALVPPSDLALPRAPKTVTVVTDGASYVVELPATDPARGGSLSFDFPTPIQTSCLAVVIDATHGGRAARRGEDPAAYLSEIAAKSALDGATLDEVAASLGGPGDGWRAREALLSGAGSAGLRAAIAAYPKLDELGRDRARRVIDAASCEAKLPLYVGLLLDRSESDRARDRVRRCGEAAAPLLLERMHAASGADRAVFAEEAALLDPSRAVPALVALLGPDERGELPPAEERRALRKAIAKAAQRKRSSGDFDQLLASEAFAKLPVRTRIDVLRSIGALASEIPSERAAFARLAADARGFDDRYLLVPSAAELARVGDETALGFVRAALLDDAEPRLRARAAEHAGGIAALRAELELALRDEAVRVREAALGSLQNAESADARVADQALRLVESDPWTFVRLRAVDVAKLGPKDPAADARLAAQVELEPIPSVRARIVEALGARKVASALPVLRARAFDRIEAAEVRLASIGALGDLCDTSSVEQLTELAERGLAPRFEIDRKLAGAAVLSLGAIAPADLADRLKPLAGVHAARDLVEATKMALAPGAGRCTRGAAARSR